MIGRKSAAVDLDGAGVNEACRAIDPGDDTITSWTINWGDGTAPDTGTATVDTPGATSIEALCKDLGIGPEQTLKTLIVEGDDGPVALVIRGDHELNAVKAQKLPGVASPLVMADDKTIRKATGSAAARAKRFS